MTVKCRVFRGSAFPRISGNSDTTICAIVSSSRTSLKKIEKNVDEAPEHALSSLFNARRAERCEPVWLGAARGLRYQLFDASALYHFTAVTIGLIFVPCLSTFKTCGSTKWVALSLDRGAGGWGRGSRTIFGRRRRERVGCRRAVNPARRLSQLGAKS